MGESIKYLMVGVTSMALSFNVALLKHDCQCTLKQSFNVNLVSLRSIGFWYADEMLQ